MKKISFLFTVIIFILSGNRASAQTELQSATLQQGDKTSIYYGKDAFISAFNAVTGVTDVITLSSGTFNSPTFNKACTVYGAGCETDESKGISSFLSPPSVARELPMTTSRPKYRRYRHLCCSVPFLHPSATMPATIGQVPYTLPTAAFGSMTRNSRNI